MDFCAAFGQNHIPLEDWNIHIVALLNLMLEDGRVKEKTIKGHLKKLQEQDDLTESMYFAFIITPVCLDYTCSAAIRHTKYGNRRHNKFNN